MTPHSRGGLQSATDGPNDAAGPTMQAYARARSRLLAVVVAVFAVPLIALAIDVDWRHGRWHAQLQGVRFIDHPEKVAAKEAAVTVSGYLVVTVRSDVDFFALARNESAHPQVEATGCASGTPLEAWLHPMPRASASMPGSSADAFAYDVLLPVRSRETDLGRLAGDVCLRFRAATMNPLSWVRSRPVVVPLGDALRGEISDYLRGGGSVDLALDPACAPQLCEPDFSPAALRP